MIREQRRTEVLALSGGVGGAKLVLGLERAVDRGRFHVAANIGDDFTHLGLSICPDIDTLLYTLSGLADPVRGWGRRDETWNFMTALEALGGPAWFRLGDGDLAMHVERTRRLAAGETLSSITQALGDRLGVSIPVWPVSDDPVRTRIRTAEGWLSFQDYFVRQACAPVVEALEYQGAKDAKVCAPLLQLLRGDALRAVIVCPSNPLLSIEPMLAVGELRRALAECSAPLIAVSPIVAGAAIKGPTAKMLRELGRPVDALEAARCYADLIDGYIVDEADAGLASHAPPGVRVIVSNTVMSTAECKERVARECLALADALAIDAPRRTTPS
jgi:LPPG:FO 2-phospho-L-lactate transferase